MKILTRSNGFKRQFKSLLKKHYSENKFKDVVFFLANGQPLPMKYKDHALIGDWKGFRECHIESNWLLIYAVSDTEVVLVATGTHDDLFK